MGVSGLILSPADACQPTVPDSNFLHLFSIYFLVHRILTEMLLNSVCQLET